jgi:hypothetical protein
MKDVIQARQAQAGLRHGGRKDDQAPLFNTKACVVVFLGILISTIKGYGRIRSATRALTTLW